jgi:predicted secreted hydrolase
MRLVSILSMLVAGIASLPQQASRAGHSVGKADAPYRLAVPGYRYEFPRDNFSHPDFQTEWWYYTGNLKGKDGRRFGFELTFFREGLLPSRRSASFVPTSHSGRFEHLSDPSERPAEPGKREVTSGFEWPLQEVYFAHLALSDLDGRHYIHTERFNRSGPGLAGAEQRQSRIWNGNWEVQWRGEVQRLQAITEQFALHLSLESLKPPVIHGRNGVSQKANGAGKASYYISLTRLAASGTLTLNEKSCDVTGLAWMDHEFFTNQLDRSQAGWDWMGLQLEDGSELMLYRLRHRDGSTDTNSAGTYVDPQGRSRHLTSADFILQPGAVTWTSRNSGAGYPVRWRIQVVSPDINLDLDTPFPQQEFTSGSRFAPSYWEGAVEAKGTKSSAPSRGVGYLEMTGYDHPLNTEQ